MSNQFVVGEATYGEQPKLVEKAEQEKPTEEPTEKPINIEIPLNNDKTLSLTLTININFKK